MSKTSIRVTETITVNGKRTIVHREHGLMTGSGRRVSLPDVIAAAPKGERRLIRKALTRMGRNDLAKSTLQGYLSPEERGAKLDAAIMEANRVDMIERTEYVAAKNKKFAEAYGKK